MIGLETGGANEIQNDSVNTTSDDQVDITKFEEQKDYITQVDKVALADENGDIKTLINMVTNLDPTEWDSNLAKLIIDAIKDQAFPEDTGLNLGDSFSAGYIVEGDIHFYPEDGTFNSSEYTNEDPIRVGLDSSPKDIGIQLIQRLQSRSVEGEWGESDWNLVDDIEKAYNVKWDEVREMV